MQDSDRTNTKVKMKKCWRKRTTYPGRPFTSLAESSFFKEDSVLFDLDHKVAWRRFSWTPLETAAYARDEAFCKLKVKQTSQDEFWVTSKTALGQSVYTQMESTN